MGIAQPSARVTSAEADGALFTALSARRLLVLTGIGMILVGMIFGDIFAVFVLHQNAARVGESLTSAAHAAVAGNVAGVNSGFQDTGSFLENRGTKVDTHVHLTGFGYLALLLALAQPWVALSSVAKKRLAWLFLFGGILLPVGVFLIHYVGLAYSPLQAIGWASIFADLGGLFVLLATTGYLAGIWKHFQNAGHPAMEDNLLRDRSTAGRILLAGGLFLVLLGFVHGAYWAAAHLYRHEAADYSLLWQMSSAAAAQNSAAVDQALGAYGQLQGDKAVTIAAHSHFIEFGMLALIIAFFQPYVSLSDNWKRRWAVILLLGSALLPICVLLELKYGLIAGGVADLGGLLVILALLAMWIGILRYAGSVDAGLSSGSTATPATAGNKNGAARRLLVMGGVVLASVGMTYGLWYAVFAEHQALDGIGASLASSFSAAAQRNVPAAESSLLHYREAKYSYDRQVDVHGHWIGLALLLVILGIAADRVGFSLNVKTLLAISILAGAFLFPLGVLLQTWSHGPGPRAIAILGSGLTIAALAGLTAGFSKGGDLA